jgi:hypothetical protein
MAHKLLRRVALSGGLLSMVLVGLPQTAMGATAIPARNITITITDSGFDKSDYTAGYSGSTPDDGASIIFVNNGTSVHTAQTVPGAKDLGATFGAATTPLGGVRACFVAVGNGCGPKLQPTNTGGITPGGGTVTLGFQPIMSGADYTLSSGPDCIYGKNPAFDCTPVTLHLVPIASRSGISGTMAGSNFRAVGSADCLASVPPIVPPTGDPYCYANGRDPGTVLGSPSKPVGDTTVTITDIMGFDPTTLYVKDGSTVTWVNKGARVHSVIEKPFTSGPYNGFDFLGGVGIGPGETYSYNFHTYPGWRAQKGTSISANVASFTSFDIVPKSAGGGQTNLIQGCGVPNAKTKVGVKAECGQPAMIGKVITIPTANSFT